MAMAGKAVDEYHREFNNVVMELRQAINLLRFTSKKRLPIVLQNEVAECGLACLAMIAGYHGRHVTLHDLRELSGVTIRGTTLGQLMQVAASLEMTARPLRLELKHLPELRLPCILHWDQTHFVVLKKMTRGRVCIADPAVGERWLTMEEVDQRFTGVALEISALSHFSRQPPAQAFALSQLWSKISGLWSSASQLVMLSVGVLLISMLLPYFVQLVIDDAISSHDLGLLKTLAIGFAILTVVQVAISTLRQAVMLVLSNQISIQVASNLFFHLIRLPVDYFEKRHIGDIASRFVSLERIREQVTSSVIEALIDGVLVIAILGLMFLYSYQLALAALASVFIYFIFKAVSFGSIKLATEQQIVASAKKDTSLIESIRAISGIKLYGRESQRMAIWQNHLADSLNHGIKAGKLNVVLQACNQLVFGLGRILIVFLAGKQILSGEMTIGALTAFISYLSQFTDKSAGLVDKWQQLKLIRIHLDRVSDIVLTDPEEMPIQHGLDVAAPVASDIRLDEVRFRYGPGGAEVLKGVSLHVKAGESVAIVGGSGQGKTTLLKILLGLLKPHEGSVLVDGLEMWGPHRDSLRKRIGAVLQDESPIAGTVAENIAFFDQEIDMERVIKASMSAGLHLDIMRMAMNYQSLVGDMGGALSGGQRQRLLIARALYHHPGVIIMDEATSNLDVMMERLVSSSIKQMQITRILVAHRPETIRSADRVFLLQEGELREVSGLFEAPIVSAAAEALSMG